MKNATIAQRRAASAVISWTCGIGLSGHIFGPVPKVAPPPSLCLWMFIALYLAEKVLGIRGFNRLNRSVPSNIIPMSRFRDNRVDKYCPWLRVSWKGADQATYCSDASESSPRLITAYGVESTGIATVVGSNAGMYSLAQVDTQTATKFEKSISRCWISKYRDFEISKSRNRVRKQTREDLASELP